MRWLVVGGVFVLFILLIFRPDERLEGVKRINGKFSIGDIVDEGIPVLIEGGAKHWIATETWDAVATANEHCNFTGSLQYLPERMENIHIHEHPYFTYSQINRPLASVLDLELLRKNEPRSINMTKTQFCTKIFEEGLLQGQQQQEYYYYSQKISQMDKRVLNDVLVDEYFVKGTSYANLEDLKVFLWIGSQGVVTRWHYDWSFNFHIVVRGKKEFQLIPPEKHWKLQLYPYLHPRATKSQIPFLLNDDESYLKKIGIVAEVKAGDVLYIPPLWFHHVKSLLPSMTLSIWSPFYETDIVNNLLSLGLPLPFEFTQDEDTHAFAVMAFIRELLLLCAPNSNGYYHIFFIKMLLQSRYGLLMRDEVHLFSVHDFECPREPLRIDKILEYYRVEVRRSVHMQWLALPLDRRELWLADYCEVAFLSLAETPSQIPAILQCFLSLFQ